MSRMVPYELVVHLASPVALEHPWLHGDSVLAYLAFQRLMSRRMYYQPMAEKAGLSRHFHERFAADGVDPQTAIAYVAGVPCCSVGLFEPEDVPWGTINYYKRVELDAFPRRGKLLLGSGRFRSWMLRTIYVPAASCRFYLLGDPDVMRDLVSDLVSLGSGTRMGWGWVRSVEINELGIDEDASLVYEGRAMRPIPVSRLVRWSDEVSVTWHAPYWDRSQVEACAPPGAEVELRHEVLEELQRRRGGPELIQDEPQEGEEGEG
jgi:hypothetical protein